MINITNNEIKFNDLEEKMWKKKMQEGLDELRDQLRRIDYQLLKSKNNECLEPKDFQPTTIKCRFGNFSIELELVNFPTNPSIFLVLIPQFFYNLFFEKKYCKFYIL